MEEENVKREASYGTIRLSRAQIGGAVSSSLALK